MIIRGIFYRCRRFFVIHWNNISNLSSSVLAVVTFVLIIITYIHRDKHSHTNFDNRRLLSDGNGISGWHATFPTLTESFALSYVHTYIVHVTCVSKNSQKFDYYCIMFACVQRVCRDKAIGTPFDFETFHLISDCSFVWSGINYLVLCRHSDSSLSSSPHRHFVLQNFLEVTIVHPQNQNGRYVHINACIGIHLCRTVPCRIV